MILNCIVGSLSILLGILRQFPIENVVDHGRAGRRDVRGVQIAGSDSGVRLDDVNARVALAVARTTEVQHVAELPAPAQIDLQFGRDAPGAKADGHVPFDIGRVRAERKAGAAIDIDHRADGHAHISGGGRGRRWPAPGARCRRPCRRP